MMPALFNSWASFLMPLPAGNETLYTIEPPPGGTNRQNKYQLKRSSRQARTRETTMVFGVILSGNIGPIMGAKQPGVKHQGAT